MLWRETRTSWARLGFFFLCVGLGVASIITLRSIVQHVRTTLTREARSLIASDIVLQSQRPFDDDVRAAVEAITAGQVEAATDVVNTQTMASPVEGEGNGNVKLVELRGVEAAFPFYGRIDLLGGGEWSHDLLAGRGAIVQPELLVALDLQPGDDLRLAGETFTIRGVIGRDRVQGGTGIAFGPRVYLDLADLRDTSLLGFGSRAGYQHLLRLSPQAPVEPLTDQLRVGLRDRFVSARSWQSLEDRIGRNLTIAENYLSLVGFAIVVLGGLGVWSVTRVIVQQKIRSIAILKCIGATGPSVLAIYLLQVLCLSAGGSLLGLGLAAAVVAAIPAALLEPLGVASVGVTASAAAQGITVGLLVSLLFGLVPLLEIRTVKPLLLLRADAAGTARRRDWRSWLAGLAIGAALLLVAVWQADSLEAGAYVSLGLGAVAAALYGAGRLLVRLTRPLARSPRFAIRHAVLGLSRPGNQTRVVLLSVGLGCFFIVSVRAMQVSLLSELSTQVGEESPDLVLIDIQSDQVAGVTDLVAPYLRGRARITPLMRGRVAAVDGRRHQLPTVEAVRDRRRLRREFGLTFRVNLEANERLVSGETWDDRREQDRASAEADTEVTVEERLFNETDLSLGDVISFDIAGTVIRARVSGVRSVDWEDSQNGGFVFVLRPAPAVDRAAHNYVGFLQVIDDPQQRGSLQRELVRTHPNVSVIDVRDVIASIREIVDNVTLGVTVVGAVTLVGGVLILVGAVAMTKFQRLYETAIYRTLGASTRLVATMMAAEYGVLGTLAGVLGTAGGFVLSWALARYLFEIDWEASSALFAAGVLGTGVTVAVVGVLASLDVLRRKPLATLRSE
jgi:putative ABC transport system permease protein